jgi:polyketide biosynthesis enoyl-CoA hydratase PksH
VAFVKYETISLHLEEKVAHLRFDRPQARNAINARMIAECRRALSTCEEAASVVILSGGPEFFCVGADFKEIGDNTTRDSSEAEHLYEVWSRLAAGPFVSVAHVRGKVNAGGVGFVAASDIVLADEGAQFSLSELLFGLMPACVLPFLVRRVGFQRAHYLTLMTQPINARTAQQWGLVDVWDARSEDLVRRHLLRLRRLTKPAIRRYKRYSTELSAYLEALKPRAVAANLEAFSDADNRAAIKAYSSSGLFPWER